jgi:poly(A) polymerase
LPLGAELKFVEKMVQLHMRPIGLADEGITDSAIRRLLFDAGDDIDSLMTLCEADVTSKNAERVKLFLEHFKIVRQKLVEIEEKDRIRNWQPPVDGLEIMERYHLAPCREVGTLKTALKDAILDGKIPNEHDAAIVFLDDLAREIGVRH